MILDEIWKSTLYCNSPPSQLLKHAIAEMAIKNWRDDGKQISIFYSMLTCLNQQSCRIIAVADQMFLGMQGFDFAQILSILTIKSLLGDVAAATTLCRVSDLTPFCFMDCQNQTFHYIHRISPKRVTSLQAHCPSSR